MSMSFKKTVKPALYGTLAAMVVAAALVVIAGCETNPGNGPDGPGTTDQRDSRLVLGNGYAWVATEIEGGMFMRQGVAYIFRSNGTQYSIASMFGIWIKDSEYEAAEWYTKDGKLYIVEEKCDRYEYTLGDDDWVCVGMYKDTTEFSYTVSANGSSLTLTGEDEDGDIMITIALQKTAWPPEGGIPGNFDPALVDRSWMNINILTGDMAIWMFRSSMGPFGVAIYMEGSIAAEEPAYTAYLARTSGDKLLLTELDLDGIDPDDEMAMMELVMEALLAGQGSQITKTYKVTGNTLVIDGKTYMDMGGGFLKSKAVKNVPAVKLPKVKKLWK